MRNLRRRCLVVPHLAPAERSVAIADLGEKLASLRLADASALRVMRASLAQHGQLSPLRAVERAGVLEVLDGFKRLHAARVLGLVELRAHVVALEGAEAIVHMRELHLGSGLSAIEEAWIVRALHRDHGLTQGEIAARLRCHKSWVCRRLMLVEALDARVQADVRLGLLAPRAAVHVASLPRGNQPRAADTVVRAGLTVMQTETFVRELLAGLESGDARDVVARWSKGRPAVPRVGGRHAALDILARDITSLRGIAGRVQACLAATPLAAREAAPVDALRASLDELAGVLRALTTAIVEALAGRMPITASAVLP